MVTCVIKYTDNMFLLKLVKGQLLMKLTQRNMGIVMNFDWRGPTIRGGGNEAPQASSARESGRRWGLVWEGWSLGSGAESRPPTI